MRTSALSIRFLAALLGCLLCVGCSAGKPSSISGVVTFEGERIEAGNIRFDPLDETPGFGASTRIENGAFAIDEGEGLFAGTYMVSISATRPTGRTISGEGLPGEENVIQEVEQFLPACYNVKSELRAEVTGGANTKDFALLTRP